MTGAETVTALALAAGAFEIPPSPRESTWFSKADKLNSVTPSKTTPDTSTSRSSTAEVPPANMTNGASASKSGTAEFSQLPAVVKLSFSPPPVHV